MDKVLSELDVPEFITKFPLIEIDLGKIPEYHLDREFAARFEYRFRKEMAMFMSEVKLGDKLATEAKGTQLRLTPARMEILSYFLFHGHLPVGTEGIAGTVEQLLLDLMLDDPKGVAEMLRLATREARSVLVRIVNSFSEKTIKKVYAILAPHHAMAVASFEKKIIAEAAKAISNESNAKIRRTVKMAILQHLLLEKSRVFDTHKFKLSVRDSVIKDLGEEARVAFKSELKDEPEEVVDLSEAKQTEQSIELIVAVLRGESEGISETDIATAWEFLITEDPILLKNVLARESSSKPERLRNLLEVIPSVQILDFIEDMAPNAGRSIITTIANVVSAHGALRVGKSEEQRFVREVHLAVLQHVLQHSEVQSSPQALAAEIRKHLEAMPNPPTKLFEEWEDLGLPPSEARAKAIEAEKAEKKAIEKAKAKAEAAAKAKEAAEKEEERIEAEIQASLKEQKEELQRIEKEAAEKREKAIEEAALLEVESLEEEVVRAKKALEEKEESLRNELQAASEKERAEIQKKLDEIEEEKKELETDEIDPSLWEYDEEEEVVDGEMVPPRAAELGIPDIKSPEGQLEFLLFFFLNGESPWWYSKPGPTPAPAYLRILLEKKPDELQAAFVEMLKTTPRSKYLSIANRIVSTFNEKVLGDFVYLLSPEISGFFGTVGLIMQKLYEAKSSEFELPQHLKEKAQFSFHFSVMYLLEYLSSSPNASQLLKFVLRETSKVTGLASRVLVKEIATLAEAGIAKGERRFVPLKSMLPKPFEGLEVPKPLEHSPEEAQLSAEALELEAELEAEIMALAKIKATEAAKAKESEEIEAAEVERLEKEQAEDLTEEERAQLEVEQLEKTRLAEEKLAQEEDEQAEIEAKEKAAIEEQVTSAEEIEAAEKEALEQPTEEERAQLEVERREAEVQAAAEKVAREKVEQEAEDAFIEAAAEEILRQAKEAAAAEIHAEKEKQAMEERERLAEELDPADFVEMVRHYLLHGSLSKEATTIFTAETFRMTIAQAFSFKDRGMIRMLMAIVGKQEVRMRLIGLGDAVALNATAMLNVMISDKLMMFVNELLEIFSLPSSPVPRMMVIEHALRFAHKHKSTSFLPMQYMQEFFAYVTNTRERKLPEVILWANKRLENSNSPLATTMIEMVDAIERLDEVRKRKRREKPDTPEVEKPRRKRPLKKLGEEIYVSNAGMPIIHPYLPQLFNMSGLLSIDRKAFKSELAATRAIHMIQYLINKEQDPPEEKLVLNKLFVGMEIDHPLIPLEDPLTEKELETMEGMMKAVVGRWSVMKNSHPDYVRKTFLDRDGRLSKRGDKWVLKVEKKGFDILVNKIPWSINPVRLPWREENIDVEW